MRKKEYGKKVISIILEASMIISLTETVCATNLCNRPRPGESGVLATPSQSPSPPQFYPQTCPYTP